MQNDLKTALVTNEEISSNIITDSALGKGFTLKEFVELFDETDKTKKFLKITTLLLKNNIAIEKIGDDGKDNHEGSLTFKFSESNVVYESSYLFRMFENLHHIIMISDEVLGATNRLKGIELLLSKFRNEELVKFLELSGADALDKAVVVSLIYLFLKRSAQMIDLHRIFFFIPKSLYVIYLNRLSQGNCILTNQQLVKYHKPDMFNDETNFSVTPRLLDLLANQQVEMI
jgi:hypothetical protein